MTRSTSWITTFLAFAALTGFAVSACFRPLQKFTVQARVREDVRKRAGLPARGYLYHGFHPGGEDGEEDAVLRNPALITSYATRVRHRPVFTYFSHEWGHESRRDDDIEAHKFPLEAVRRVATEGGIPFVRLMLRTSSASANEKREKYFTLENILGSEPRNEDQRKITEEVKTDLLEWGRVAREEYAKPLIVEWGTEANNKTFHWNANQARDKEAATALFRKAFRYIVHTVSDEHPENSNIAWVFHVTAESDPDTSERSGRADWNKMADYYPDDRPGESEPDVVDWLGVSIYGVDNLDKGDCVSFASQLETALGRVDGRGSNEKLLALAHRGGKDKPILILEFGTALNYTVKKPMAQCVPQTWIDDAFTNIFAKFDEGIISGFSWWNERYKGEGSGKPLELRFDYLELPMKGGAPNETSKNNQMIVDRYVSRLDDKRVTHGPSTIQR